MNLQKILAFYRARVEAHEKDRFAYLQKMDKLRLKQDKAHKLEWELKKRADERQEL
jgi:coiled-coil domain-containing protein 77